MRVGIIGLKGSGKTTLFHALIGREIGFTKKEENIGVVKVPDERLDKLHALHPQNRKVPAEITFIDLPTEYSSDGKSFTRDTIAKIREVDGLCVVLGGYGQRDPIEEYETLNNEFILADLMVVEKRLELLKKQGKRDREYELLDNLKGYLEKGTKIKGGSFSQQDLRLFSGFRFITEKPEVILINVEEGKLGDKSMAETIFRFKEKYGVEPIVASCLLEYEISRLDFKDQREFLSNYGLESSLIDRFIRATYNAMELISFFTIGGGEVKAWTLKRGTTVLKAAGKIHSDMERGFIRAEVIHVSDYIEHGGEKECRTKGKYRLEGKDYIVQDGDILTIKFNV